MSKKSDINIDVLNGSRRINEFLEAWVLLLIRKQHIEDWLIEHNYSNVAIYGMGELGQLCFEELKQTKISVLYGIDRRKDELPIKELKIVDFDNVDKSVDVIIVTAINSFDDIKRSLNEKYSIPVVSIEDIVFDVVCDMKDE